MVIETPHLFSISAGQPFLPTLADAIYDGTLTGGNPISDPLALAQMLIYVPTRRAARSLRAALVQKRTLHSSFLPTIRALGDSLEEQSFFAPPFDDTLALNPPIPPYERLQLLAQMVRPWREKMPDFLRALFGAENVVIPASTADAIWLARDLARLMDEMEREGGDWSKLETIAPDMVAEWWQVTLEFLKIIRDHWPKILEARGFSNPIAWRNALLKKESERLKLFPPKGPIIAAGSTGAMAAIADLLKTIAFLPKGAVVLPNLDRDMSDDIWKKIGQVENDASVYGHPQYGLKLLLEKMGAKRDMVQHLGEVTPEKRIIEKVVSDAMMPADATEHWAKINLQEKSTLAFENISLIEATSEREEALAVACALRAAIEDKNKNAALVTNDRNLARRVSVELERFGIQANDSGGRPLFESEPVALLRLILECVFNPGDPVTLLSLLKHPLTRIGLKRSQLRQTAERFELLIMRGGAGRVSLIDIVSFVERRIHEKEQSRQEINSDDIIVVKDFAKKIFEAFQPLLNAREEQRQFNVAEAVEKTIEVFENLGRDIDGSLEALYDGEAGASLIRFLRQLLGNVADFTFEIDEWPSIFQALIAEEAVSAGLGGHQRLFIWGTLEARLQNVNTIVIAGLNEGVFPSLGRNDPFISRSMKMNLSLQPPEREIGLSAHDFQMMMGQERVILSRSLRIDNAPSVPSRWLQRLETVLGEEESIAMRQRGAIYVDWARLIDDDINIPFITQPNPIPPIETRPKRFSVTEIETLRRDPYAIYAKKILRLSPMEELIREPSFAERGTLYHAIVARFSDEKINPHSSDALEKLLHIAREEFNLLQLPLDVEAIWWPRFEVLAKHYIDWEKEQPKREHFAEVSAQATPIFQTGIYLSGRADRIDISNNNHATIVDFKTGTSPSLKQAATLIAPQLALEGALLMRGAFEQCGVIKPDDLVYVRLRSNGDVYSESVPLSAKKTAVELSEDAWSRLGELVDFYNNPAQGYRSRALPPIVNYEGDYDHLARVLEWSSSEDGGDD